MHCTGRTPSSEEAFFFGEPTNNQEFAVRGSFVVCRETLKGCIDDEQRRKTVAVGIRWGLPTLREKWRKAEAVGARLV